MVNFDYNSILERMKQDLSNDSARVEGCFCMDNLQAVGLELARLYSTEIEPIPDRFFLDTTFGDYLDRKAVEFNEQRHPAQAAKGIVLFKGDIGKLIPKGIRVVDPETSLVFSTLEQCIIAENGLCEVLVSCNTAGEVGNILPDKITEIHPMSNLVNVTVNNPNAMANGLEAETDEAFRSRIIEKIRKPITSGNENHYVYWAKQIAGIGNARCVGCWAGAGTVKVILFSTDYDVPSAEVIENVRRFIEENRPIGANVTTMAASPYEISITCNLKLKVGAILSEVQNILETTVKSYLNAIIKADKLGLSYYKVGDLLFDIEGVEDVISFTINGLTNSITIDIDNFFSLKEVVINVVTQR